MVYSSSSSSTASQHWQYITQRCQQCVCRNRSKRSSAQTTSAPSTDAFAAAAVRSQQQQWQQWQQRTVQSELHASSMQWTSCNVEAVAAPMYKESSASVISHISVKIKEKQLLLTFDAHLVQASRLARVKRCSNERHQLWLCLLTLNNNNAQRQTRYSSHSLHTTTAVCI
jgi:hypothetical protein